MRITNDIRNRYIFRKSAFVLVAALSIGLGSPSPGFAREGSFLVDLNTRQVTELASLGGGNTHAGDINNSGQITGSSGTSTGETHAFITGLNGVGMRDLGTLGGSSSYGTAINATGQVAGSSDSSTGPHVFITGPNGAGMRDLDGGESYASDINSTGQVVGFSYAIPGNAFITGPNGMGMRGLGTLGGDYGGGANGINDAGWVVGSSSTKNMGIHAFITGPNGMGMTDLGSLGGSSEAYDINAAGQVIGFSATGDGKQHAFITGPGGVGMTDLGTLGGDSSAAWAINAAGQVVGGSSVTGDSRTHAFITGPDGTGMTDLNTLVNVTGLTLTSANAINDQGQVLAAGIIPEPEIHLMLLAGLGLLGLIMQRRLTGTVAGTEAEGLSATRSRVVGSLF